MATILKNGHNFWTIKARGMQLVLAQSPRDFEQLLFQAFFSYLFKKYGRGTILHWYYALMAAILKNRHNFWSINARGVQLILAESPRDFEQLLYQAFFSYLFKK